MAGIRLSERGKERESVCVLCVGVIFWVSMCLFLCLFSKKNINRKFHLKENALLYLCLSP